MLKKTQFDALNQRKEKKRKNSTVENNFRSIFLLRK